MGRDGPMAMPQGKGWPMRRRAIGNPRVVGIGKWDKRNDWIKYAPMAKGEVADMDQW